MHTTAEAGAPFGPTISMGEDPKLKSKKKPAKRPCSEKETSANISAKKLQGLTRKQ